MNAIDASIGTALWLGILTSISPCPLASNVAAISFVGRSLSSPRQVLLAGLLYSVGRAVAYIVVGVVVASGLLSLPIVSLFLQQRMNQVLGPLLVLIGVGLLGWIRLPTPSWSVGTEVKERVAGSGLAGASALGMLFALSFCPVSAGLFFGALIPLAVSTHSPVVLPGIYGIGTGVPVVGFALLVALGAQGIGRVLSNVAKIERALRPATGVIFILAGLYLALTHLFGAPL